MKRSILYVPFLRAIAVLVIASPAFLLRSDVSATSSPPANPYRENTAVIQGTFDPNSYYRLTTEWQGEGKSLDIINDRKNNNQPRLADTGNSSGQHWKITKVK